MPQARVLIAPNALKESCTAPEAARAMAEGAARACPGCILDLLPVADGGDGLLDVLESLWQDRKPLQTIPVRVQGPRGAPIDTIFLWLPEERTAVIEMARASGLALLTKAERNPALTSTLGAGQCLRAALDRGAARVLIGLGGSATHDGGMGLASALGFRFLDANDRELQPMGAHLGQVARIDARAADPRLSDIEMIGLRDVDNPLCGPRGAAAIYAPQKGARAEQIAKLDAGLRQLAGCFARDLGIDVSQIPGAGAAGGLGGGLIACCGARLEPGAAYLLKLADFATRLNRASLVLTAEGRLDASSLHGKATGTIAARAAEAGVPCIALAGAIPVAETDCQRLHQAGLSAFFSLCSEPLPLDQAQRRSSALLAATTEQILRLWRRSTTA